MGYHLMIPKLDFLNLIGKNDIVRRSSIFKNYIKISMYDTLLSFKDGQPLL